MVITAKNPNFNLVKAQTLLELLQLQRGCKEYKLKVSARKKRVLGTCYYDRREIVVSAYLDDIKVANTIKHEFAHALAGPFQGHGLVWAEKCQLLGIPATPCAPQYAMEYAPKEGQRYNYYTCDCKTHQFKRKLKEMIGRKCTKCHMLLSDMEHYVGDGNGNPFY